jgi:hypothetical protein
MFGKTFSMSHGATSVVMGTYFSISPRTAQWSESTHFLHFLFRSHTDLHVWHVSE